MSERERVRQRERESKTERERERVRERERERETKQTPSLVAYTTNYYLLLAFLVCVYNNLIYTLHVHTIYSLMCPHNTFTDVHQKNTCT